MPQWRNVPVHVQGDRTLRLWQTPALSESCHCSVNLQTLLVMPTLRSVQVTEVNCDLHLNDDINLFQVCNLISWKCKYETGCASWIGNIKNQIRSLIFAHPDIWYSSAKLCISHPWRTSDVLARQHATLVQQRTRFKTSLFMAILLAHPGREQSFFSRIVLWLIPNFLAASAMVYDSPANLNLGAWRAFVKSWLRMCRIALILIFLVWSRQIWS